MQLSVALDNVKTRNLAFFVGDRVTLGLVVYAVDGDLTPIAVTNARIVAEHAPATIPVGSAFTVPDIYARTSYRLLAEVAGITTTLAYGTIFTRGGTRCPSDYGGVS